MLGLRTVLAGCGLAALASWGCTRSEAIPISHPGGDHAFVLKGDRDRARRAAEGRMSDVCPGLYAPVEEGFSMVTRPRSAAIGPRIVRTVQPRREWKIVYHCLSVPAPTRRPDA